jgi:hypothetical protein
VTTGLLGAGALLLLVAGAAKVVDPSRTVGALVTLGWRRATRRKVRIGAAGETILGAATLAVSNVLLAALVAFSYLGFTAFVVKALRSGRPVGSCGCLGSADTPPSVTHIAVNLVLATGAILAALTGPIALVDASWGSVALAAALAAGAAFLLTRR